MNQSNQSTGQTDSAYTVSVSSFLSCSGLNLEEGLIMSELEIILMKRDDLTLPEAQSCISEMYDQIVEQGIDPEEVLFGYGLETDYIFDII